MPYSIRKSKDEGYDIIKKSTGEKVGHSASEAAAKRSIQARLASEHGWKPKKK